MRHFLFRWGPALGLMLVIFIVSAQPESRIPNFGAWDWLVKNGGHMIGYALLSVAMLHGVRGGRPAPLQHVAWAFALTLLYALSDEYHQAFVPGRFSDVWDLGLDAVGATIGLALRRWWIRPLAAPSQSRSESNRR